MINSMIREADLEETLDIRVEEGEGGGGLIMKVLFLKTKLAQWKYPRLRAH